MRKNSSNFTAMFNNSNDNNQNNSQINSENMEFK